MNIANLGGTAVAWALVTRSSRQLPVIGGFSRRVCRSAGAPHACVRL